MCSDLVRSQGQPAKSKMPCILANLLVAETIMKLQIAKVIFSKVGNGGNFVRASIARS